MRTPIYALIAALLVGGCTHYHVTPAGAPASQPDRVSAPEPEPVEPLELDIGRPHGGQLLLQTNRPAYVAIFEIIPNRGVTLIYPAAAHQQNMLVSGLTWVPLWWSPRRVSTSDRYIYAVASEEPLRLSGETFETGYFSRVLGVRIYRAESPYSTMRSISRTVVPDVADEQWAEDVQVITPTYVTEAYRTARIYCPGGRVFDVPEEMLGRIWCPTRTRVVIVDAGRPKTRDYPVGRPARPDSVYGHGGGRIKLEPRRRGPITRIVDPTGRDRDDRPTRPARDDRDDRYDRTDRGQRGEPKGGDDKDSEKPEKPKRGLLRDLMEKEKQKREAEKERERQEREARRREAEEKRDEQKDERRDERDARKDEREEQKEERKDERENEREARKQEREERKEERKEEREERKDERKEERREEPRREEPRREEPRREEPRQQGDARGEEKREEKREEKQEKQEKQEKRDEPRDDNKGRSIRDLMKGKKP